MVTALGNIEHFRGHYQMIDVQVLAESSDSVSAVLPGTHVRMDLYATGEISDHKSCASVRNILAQLTNYRFRNLPGLKPFGFPGFIENKIVQTCFESGSFGTASEVFAAAPRRGRRK